MIFPMFSYLTISIQFDLPEATSGDGSASPTHKHSVILVSKARFLWGNWEIGLCSFPSNWSEAHSVLIVRYAGGKLEDKYSVSSARTVWGMSLSHYLSCWAQCFSEVEWSKDVSGNTFFPTKKLCVLIPPLPSLFPLILFLDPIIYLLQHRDSICLLAMEVQVHTYVYVYIIYVYIWCLPLHCGNDIRKGMQESRSAVTCHRPGSPGFRSGFPVGSVTVGWLRQEPFLFFSKARDTARREESDRGTEMPSPLSPSLLPVMKLEMSREVWKTKILTGDVLFQGGKKSDSKPFIIIFFLHRNYNRSWIMKYVWVWNKSVRIRFGLLNRKFKWQPSAKQR